MNMSEKIDLIAPALVAIQDRMTVATDAESEINYKSKTGGSGTTVKSKYAQLSTILATIRPALKDEGLTIFQTIDTVDRVVKCTTRIFHTSGQWVDSVISVTAAGLSPQMFGSAISYARRYGVAAALSLAIPQDDDDGDKAEIAYLKAEEKEKLATDLRKFQAAALPNLLKYDSEVIELAFAEHGYISEEEVKDKMVSELLGQTSSKEKITHIGLKCLELQKQVEESLNTQGTVA